MKRSTTTLTSHDTLLPSNYSAAGELSPGVSTGTALKAKNFCSYGIGRSVGSRSAFEAPWFRFGVNVVMGAFTIPVCGSGSGKSPALSAGTQKGVSDPIENLGPSVFHDDVLTVLLIAESISKRNPVFAVPPRSAVRIDFHHSFCETIRNLGSHFILPLTGVVPRICLQVYR